MTDRNGWDVSAEDIALESVDDGVARSLANEFLPATQLRRTVEAYVVRITPVIHELNDAVARAADGMKPFMAAMRRFAEQVDTAQREAGKHKPGRGRRAPANAAKRRAARVVKL